MNERKPSHIKDPASFELSNFSLVHKLYENRKVQYNDIIFDGSYYYFAKDNDVESDTLIKCEIDLYGLENYYKELEKNNEKQTNEGLENAIWNYELDKPLTFNSQKYKIRKFYDCENFLIFKGLKIDNGDIVVGQIRKSDLVVTTIVNLTDILKTIDAKKDYPNYRNISITDNDSYLIVFYKNVCLLFNKLDLKYIQKKTFSNNSYKEIVNSYANGNIVYLCYKYYNLEWEGNIRKNVIKYKLSIITDINNNSLVIKDKIDLISNVYGANSPYIVYMTTIDNVLYISLSDKTLRLYNINFDDLNYNKTINPGYTEGENYVTFIGVDDLYYYLGNEIGDLVIYEKESNFDSNEMYIDNICNNKINRIFVFNQYLFASSNSKGLSVYKNNYTPSIDKSSIYFNNFIAKSMLNVDIKFTLLHGDKLQKMKYRVRIVRINDENKVFNTEYSEWNEGMRNGDSTPLIKLSIPCSELEYYDLKLILEIEDKFGQKDYHDIPIKTVYADEPVCLKDAITIGYQTASISDLKLAYKMYIPTYTYKRTSVLSEDAIRLSTITDYDLKNEIIESINFDIDKENEERTYVAIVEEWHIEDYPDFYGEMDILSTNGLDWLLSVDEKGHIITQPYSGISYDYISIPIPKLTTKDEKFNNEKFIFQYKFYTEEYPWEYARPDGGEFYVYDYSDVINTVYKQREDGDISRNHDFHLLDIISAMLKVVPIGKYLYLKTSEAEDALVYKVGVDDNGHIMTTLMDEEKLLSINKSEIRTHERLSFRESIYKSRITVKSQNGTYWDLDIINKGNGRTTVNRDIIANDLTNLIFVTRADFDYNEVANCLKRLSNPVRTVVSNRGNQKYKMKSSFDALGNPISISLLNRLEFILDQGFVEDENGDYVKYNGYYVYRDSNNSEHLNLKRYSKDSSEELFTSNYHYFNVYVNGKKMYNDEIDMNVDRFGRYTVSFPYSDDNAPEIIKINYQSETYEIYLNYEDRLIINRTTPSDEPEEICFSNFKIFLTKDNKNNIELHHEIFTPIEDRRYRKYDKRKFWEHKWVVVSDTVEIKNTDKEINLKDVVVHKDYVDEFEPKVGDLVVLATEYPTSRPLICESDKVLRNLMLTKQDRLTTSTINEYGDNELEYKDYPIEVNLNHGLNDENEFIMHSVLIKTQEDVDSLHAGTFRLKCANIGDKLTIKDFKIFIKFKHAAYYSRVDSTHYKLTWDSSNSDSTLFLKLDSNIWATIGSEIVLTTMNVNGSITLRTDSDGYKPYYYLPLIRYDSYGNLRTFYTENISEFEVIVNGYTLIPNKDYCLVNCYLHSHMPSMLVFEDIIEKNTKVEINFNSKDVYDTLILNNPENSDIVEIRDNVNIFLNGTFAIYVNERKLDYTQYEILDRKTLKLKVPNRENIVVRFQYKNIENIDKLLEILHMSDEFMAQSESSNMSTSLFGTDEYSGIKDPDRVNSVYTILGYTDECFKNNRDAILDCNIEIPNIIDSYINTGVFYNLDYMNNDLDLDSNIDYDRFDYTDFLPPHLMPKIEDQ